jgi:hypothetical protein
VNIAGFHQPGLATQLPFPTGAEPSSPKGPSDNSPAGGWNGFVALLSVASENIPLDTSPSPAARQAQHPGTPAHGATPKERTKCKITPELASNPNRVTQFTPEESQANDTAAILITAVMQRPPAATSFSRPDSAPNAAELSAGQSHGNVAVSLNRHTELTSATLLSGENGTSRLDTSIAFALRLTPKTPESLLPALAPESAVTPATLQQSTSLERAVDPELAVPALDSKEQPDVARVQTTIPIAPDSTIRFAPVEPAPSPAMMPRDPSSAGNQLAAPASPGNDASLAGPRFSYRSLTAEKMIPDSAAAAMLAKSAERRGQGPVPETPQARVATAVSHNTESSEINPSGSSRPSMTDRSFQEQIQGFASAGTSSGSPSADSQAPAHEDSPTQFYLPALRPVQTNAPDQPVAGVEPSAQTTARQEKPAADSSQPEEPATSPEPAPKIEGAENNPANAGRDNSSHGSYSRDAFSEVFPLAAGPLVTRGIPRAPDQTLEAPPEIAAPDTATAGARPAIAREISIKLEGANASSVAVQLTERAGKIDIAVRTTDSQLNKSLQSGLGDLVTQLEGHGFKTDAWTPGAARVAALTPGSSEPSANPQQSGHPGSWSSKQDREGQGDSNPRRQTRTSSAFEQTLAEEDTKDGVHP